jgi:hypothetical protein
VTLLKLTSAVLSAVVAAFLLATGAAAMSDRDTASLFLPLGGAAFAVLAVYLYRSSAPIRVPEGLERAAWWFFPFFHRSGRAHHVTVLDTRPLPDDAPFEPYFCAVCDCGWVGSPRQSSQEAFSDAHKHDTNVSQVVERPLG